jgi:hypothetical protein
VYYKLLSPVFAGLFLLSDSRRDRKGATNAKRDSSVASYFSLRALREIA